MGADVFLKRLSIKGFKSFADTAVLEMEPGVTVVVGPNGSGKSNVVDAIAWVLGAQAPSAVRSQKMDDVIFAGTATRAALGRAEVSLTIDNSSGQLPVEFGEVTITRTLFRAGDSEYSMNGAPCRLLDIQELLSYVRVWRQHHVSIAHVQPDAVLHPCPDELPTIIDHAAVVAQHRRRRDAARGGRAERRLAGGGDGESAQRDPVETQIGLHAQGVAGSIEFHGAAEHALIEADFGDFRRRHAAFAIQSEVDRSRSDTARLPSTQTPAHGRVEPPPAIVTSHSPESRLCGTSDSCSTSCSSASFGHEASSVWPSSHGRLKRRWPGSAGASHGGVSPNSLEIGWLRGALAHGSARLPSLR